MAVISISPGWAFILRILARQVILPTAATYTCYQLLSSQGYESWIPPFIRSVPGLFIAAFGLRTVFGVITSLRTSIQTRHASHRLGAELLPRLKGGKWPGNLDIVIDLQKSMPKEYLGEGFDRTIHANNDPMMFDVLGTETIWTYNPHYIKEMLTTQFTNFIKGQSVHDVLDSVLGSGIFNSDGEAWKFHRSMTRPFFARDRVRDFDIFDQHADLLIRKMQACAQTDTPFDFQEAITQFSMDSASEFLFGQCVHALATPFALPGGKRIENPNSSSTAQLAEFSRVFQVLIDTIGLRLKSNYPWQLNEIFDDPISREMKAVDQYIKPMIENALEKAKRRQELGGEGRKTHEEGDDLLTSLASQTQDRKIIKDELLNILFAGRDTTASNLTMVTYFLAMYPRVLERLRKEILGVVGPTQRPDHGHIRELKYLRAVINETLRLMPPVPFEIKESVNETVFTDPKTGRRWYIPAGRKIIWSTHTLQRSKEYWGPDAMEFDPDRWLDQRNKTYYLANPFIFIPFLAGPRICLGQQFAYNEISFFLIRFLQRFEHVELAPDAHPPDTLPHSSWKEDWTCRKAVERIVTKSHLTLYAKGGVWVRLQCDARQELKAEET